MDLAARYERVRGATEALAAPLSPEDCAAQSMTEASPVKWHLAHTSWFFETFVLERALSGYRGFSPEFRVLFNSYYNSVGEQHPRPERGLLTRPSHEQVLAYRAHVDRHMRDLFARGEITGPLAPIAELGLEHEQQHQELILTDVKHLLGCNPIHPVYRAAPARPDGQSKPLSWHHYPGGIHSIGYEGEGFCFDNERPRHRVILEPFELASRLVTNDEYLAFMGDDGYERPELWLSDGWAVIQERGWRAPLYWEEVDGEWHALSLAGFRPVAAQEPVCHLSYYEADAYARWAAARLPSEEEWEAAASGAPVEGNFVESGCLHPRPSPNPRDGEAPLQMFGDVWEWTGSAYEAYPGYRPPPGAIGEYNGKFMCNQYVLRGGSCATPREHVRASYRNFFYPDARWQFSGVRLARDAR